jgi:hypothetical protein
MLDFYQDKEKILKAFEKLGDEDIYKKVIETRNAITHGYFKEYADYSVGLFYKYNISGQGLENLIESDEDFLEDAKFIAGSVLPLLTEISKKVGAIKDGFFFRELGRYLNLLQGYAFRVEDVMIGPDYEEFRGKLIEEVNDVIKLIEEVEKKFAKEISEMNIIGIDEITTGSPKSLKQLCQEIRVSLGLDEE